jgi:hypothetical protein
VESFDRYSQFRNGKNINLIPFGKIEKRSSDMYETYIKGVTRLDQLSYKYYGNPDYGWLILQANPHLGSLWYAIDDMSEIRIPFPLATALVDYQKSIDEYNNFYKK